MHEQTTHQKVALVTGANKGIGRAAAGQLAALGMTVLLGARDPQRGEEAAAALRAAGGDAHAVTLYVTDPTTIQEAAKQAEERFGHLDVLINNAGISGSGQVSPEDAYDQVPSSVDLDMVRAVFETNVFGVIAVTNAMLPLLRRSPAPRIVNVSSHAASLTITSDPGRPLCSAAAVGGVRAVQDRADRADRAVRQCAAEGRHPDQRRRPRLRRHGQQQPHRGPYGRAGRRGVGALGHARRGRADRGVLQRGGPGALVIVALTAADGRAAGNSGSRRAAYAAFGWVLAFLAWHVVWAVTGLRFPHHDWSGAARMLMWGFDAIIYVMRGRRDRAAAGARAALGAPGPRGGCCCGRPGPGARYSAHAGSRVPPTTWRRCIGFSRGSPA